MKDLTIAYDDCMINIRVAAIIRKDDSVLLGKSCNDDFWSLPGGRVKSMEPLKVAIARELQEEVGEHFCLQESYLFSENFFTLKDKNFHEYCTYFNALWTSESQEDIVNEKEKFKWFRVHDLTKIDIRPTFIVSYLQNQMTEHSFEFHNELK